MSREILDCLKRERDICIQNIILRQNTALKWTPALRLLVLLRFSANFFGLDIKFYTYDKMFFLQSAEKPRYEFSATVLRSTC